MNEISLRDIITLCGSICGSILLLIVNSWTQNRKKVQDKESKKWDEATKMLSQFTGDFDQVNDIIEKSELYQYESDSLDQSTSQEKIAKPELPPELIGELVGNLKKKLKEFESYLSEEEKNVLEKKISKMEKSSKNLQNLIYLRLEGLHMLKVNGLTIEDSQSELERVRLEIQGFLSEIIKKN